MNSSKQLINCLLGMSYLLFIYHNILKESLCSILGLIIKARLLSLSILLVFSDFDIVLLSNSYYLRSRIAVHYNEFLHRCNLVRCLMYSQQTNYYWWVEIQDNFSLNHFNYNINKVSCLLQDMIQYLWQ